MRRGGLALAFLLVLGGCSVFRASVGVGLGIGGSVKAGPVDVGCLGGVDVAVGNYYDISHVHLAGDVGVPLLARVELLVPAKNEGRLGFTSPLALPLYPLYASSDDEGVQKALPFLFPRPMEVAVSAYALLVAVHLGVDFGALADTASNLVSVAAGGDERDPPLTAATPVPAPDDGLLDAGVAIITTDDLAALESGTAVELARRARGFAQQIGDPHLLVQLPDERGFERWVDARTALEGYDFQVGTRERIEALLAAAEREDLAAAARSDDPRAIDAALARYPLAPARTQADLERRRGERLLEEGSVELAAWSFEDALRHLESDEDTPDDERLAATKRLVLARRLVAARGPGPIVKNSWSGSAELDGAYLGASDRAVWCLTRSGDVAWERSDALPAGFTESKVIGASSGLALLECQSEKGRPWVVALDDVGRVAWTTPLPVPAGCGSAMDQFYALGLGRVFVARPDCVLALDAASGRALWMTKRTDIAWAFEPPKTIVPMDWKPPPGPPRRRPDGERGFQVVLAGDELFVKMSAQAKPLRLEARTGEPR